MFGVSIIKRTGCRRGSVILYVFGDIGMNGSLIRTAISIIMYEAMIILVR